MQKKKSGMFVLNIIVYVGYIIFALFCTWCQTIWGLLHTVCVF